MVLPGADLCLRRLLVQNSRREIPQSESAEREQKAKLSQALTNFLQACSGPAEGQEHVPDAMHVWAQAVSILQMRDATQVPTRGLYRETAARHRLTRAPDHGPGRRWSR